MPKQILTYSDFGKHLRLGNFLYSYYMLLKYSKKYNRDLILPDYYLWNYLKNNPFKVNNEMKADTVFHFDGDRPETAYIDKFFEENIDEHIEINLNPYCQSELIWLDYKDYIIEMMEFKEEEISKIKEQYSNILSKKTIGISIRLGTDFTGDRNFFQISHKWYIAALNKFFPTWKKEYNVCIFSDNIETAKVLFGTEFYYAEPNNSYILKYDSEHFHTPKAINHLILGSLMDNFIVSNSTFSWQMAYLSQNRKNNKEGLVICSGKNFANDYYEKSQNNNTYYPSNWIKYEENLI
jgi:hypothetical protein